MSTLLIGLAVLFVLFLLWALGSLSCPSPNERLLTGCWTADPAFCEEAGLQTMIIFLGEPCLTWTTARRRTGHIYAVLADGTELTNTLFELSTGGLGGLSGLDKVTFAGPAVLPGTSGASVPGALGEGAEDAKALTWELDACKGTLRIYCAETSELFGLFYKDCLVGSMLD